MMEDQVQALVMRAAMGDDEAIEALIELAEEGGDVHPLPLVRIAANPPPLREASSIVETPLPGLFGVFARWEDTQQWHTFATGLLELGDEDEALIETLDRLLTARWPDAGRVVTSDWEEAFFDEEEHPATRLFRTFDHDEIELDDMEQFAASAQLRHITHLRMEGVDLVEDDWATLGTNPHLAQVAVLNCCGSCDGVCIGLVTSPHLSGVRALDLASCEFTDAHVERLVRAENLRGLEVLDMGMNPDWNQHYFSAEGLRAIAASPVLSRLRKLNVCLYDTPDLDGWRAIATGPNAHVLESLIIQDFSTPPETLRMLVGPTRLERLQTLHISGVRVDDGDWDEVVEGILREATGLPALRSFGCDLSEAQGQWLLSSGIFPALETIT